MTGDRAALLAAVLAAPDDDAPRLVLADWLEEFAGEDGRQRAAFIRREVGRRHRKFDPYDDTVDYDFPKVIPWATASGRRYWGADGNARLWKKGEIRAVCSSLPAPTNDEWRATFARGFVVQLECASHDWLTHAAHILAEHPIQTVTLTTWAFLAADANGWAEASDEAYFRRRWPRIRFVMPSPNAPLYRNFGTEAVPQWERYE